MHGDDEMLEECDEPVPLPDPGGPPSLPASAAEASLVLPENLELLPNSGSHPGMSGQPAK
jgi:hypothetical protein